MGYMRTCYFLETKWLYYHLFSNFNIYKKSNSFSVFPIHHHQCIKIYERKINFFLVFTRRFPFSVIQYIQEMYSSPWREEHFGLARLKYFSPWREEHFGLLARLKCLLCHFSFNFPYPARGRDFSRNYFQFQTILFEYWTSDNALWILNTRQWSLKTEHQTILFEYWTAKKSCLIQGEEGSLGNLKRPSKNNSESLKG